jgi:hypothetical protein
MYSRFLEEAGYDQATLAREASDAWTEVALAARTASEPDQPDPGHWTALSDQAVRVLDAEERLWSALAART